MANKSVGQWVGTIVGAVIGFFVPGSYVALGAALGGAIGGAIDPPKGPKVVGPRLSDLSVQTASYGSAIPRVYGTVGLYGTVIWIENNQLRETEKTETQGGKGGGGSETTTYSYSVTCAILLCEGPIVGVRRIWAGSKLIYDGSASSVEGMIASNSTIAGITIYPGDETQTPNSRIQMTLGAGNVSAFRGYAYAVIEDFQLADYGNSMLGCPFKFEVMTAATFAQYSQPSYHPDNAFPRFLSYGPCLGRIESGVMKFDHLGTTYTVSANGDLVDTRPSDLGTFPAWGHVGMLGNQSVDYLSADYTGWLTVGSTQLMYHHLTSATLPAGVWHMMGACVDKAGTRLYVLAHRESDASNWLHIYDENLNLLSQGSQSAYPFAINAGSYPLIQGTTEAFTVEEGGEYLWHADSYGGNVFVHPIASGVVGSALHTFGNQFMGAYGSRLTIAAADSMCWGATDGGGMFIFSRASVATPALVSLASIIEAECVSTGYLSAGDIDTTTITDDVRGYRVANNAAVRSALEALQAPYPFDVIQDGYGIKFVKRGTTSVATIAYDDMATTADAKTDEPRITVVREMDAQLPRRIEITYFDAAREYDTGEQAAERLNSTGTSLVRVELPVVLTADEGAQCAEMLLYLYHLERLDISLALPTRSPYSKLQPADVITAVTPQASYLCRITSITHESNRVIKLTARLADVALYSPTAVGGVSNVSALPISLTGPSLLTILDIPVVGGANDGAGVVFAGRGAYSGWRGANVLRSDDGGVSWLKQAGITAPGATIALATNTIGDGPTNAMDVSNVLNVKMSSGDISSVTELALFNGANHFAYGEPGRWEIIGARTVALQADGSYNLSNLLRGRFGTEWAMTSHAALDDVILLDLNGLGFSPQPTAIIGASRMWSILGYGDADATQNSRAFTYAGENLECLSPVHVHASQAASGDWTIQWVRRTRVDGEWRDYVDAALGETSENYVVDIYDDNTYTTLKRTITSTVQSASYTNAQQTADFGAAIPDLYFRVSQVSDLVGPGRSLNSSATSPYSFGDPSWANTVALLHMNDTGLTDVTGKAVTVGSASRSSAQSKFGGYSALFGASGTPLSMPDSSDFAFTADFCIEAFVYPTTSTGTLIIAAKRSSSTYCPFYFALDAGKLYGIFSLSGAGWDASLTGATTVPLNQWSHVAITRLSGTVTVWLEGVSDATVGLSGALMTNTSPVYIGGEYDGTKGLDGYLDEMRIKKGVAVYSGTFTPPAAPFPNF